MICIIWLSLLKLELPKNTHTYLPLLYVHIHMQNFALKPHLVY